LCGGNEGFAFADASLHWDTFFICIENRMEELDMSDAEMIPYGGFDIKISDDNIDFSKRTDLTKLELTSGQKMHISALWNAVPSLATVGTKNACVLHLPDGVTTSDLIKYQNGGLGNIYRGADGKFAGQAPLELLGKQQVIMGAFTAMSIASGQYFLSEINSNLMAINQKIDKILEFLYGDKKAELISEVSFVNYAYQNYISIMECDHQRTATITSLQSAKKVAMKDIEFYMSDLDSLIKAKDTPDLDEFINKAFQIKDCLQLAIQLYCMSNILEVSYSQNGNSLYHEYVEKDILSYIDKYEKRMLSNFSAIQMYIKTYKGNPLKKIDKSVYERQVEEFVDSLGSDGEFIKRKPLQSFLQSFQKESTFILDMEGNAYLKTA